MRVKVEFEAEANFINGHWTVWYKDVFYHSQTTRLPNAWVTPLECPEPTENGYYKVTYNGGVKTIVSRSSNDWYIIGSSRPNTWLELGNIVAAERIEL